jgi:hypothetical protein
VDVMHQPAREVMGAVQMRQNRTLEANGLFGPQLFQAPPLPNLPLPARFYSRQAANAICGNRN